MSAEKRELSRQFIEAIDRCAMRVGARDSDAYLAQWRRGATQVVEGDDKAVADLIAAEIEVTYDAERLAALVAGDGYDKS